MGFLDGGAIQTLDLDGGAIEETSVIGVGACVAPSHDVRGAGFEIFEGDGACVAPAHDITGTGEEIFEGAAACVAPAHDVGGVGIVVLNLPGQAVVTVDQPPCPFVNVSLDAGVTFGRVDRPCDSTLTITRPV